MTFQPTRRGFMKAAAPMIVPSSVLGQRSGAVPPSDRIVMGGIGIGARGTSDLRALISYGQVKFVAGLARRGSRYDNSLTATDIPKPVQLAAMHGIITTENSLSRPRHASLAASAVGLNRCTVSRQRRCRDFMKQ
jgi:hypothetical protein